MGAMLCSAPVLPFGLAFVRHDSDIFVQAQMSLAAPSVPFGVGAATFCEKYPDILP